MKALQLIAWIVGIIAAILALLGTIAFIFKVELFGIHHAVNYFNVADSYLLIAILCLLLKKTLKE
jgi:hypothetical protein